MESGVNRLLRQISPHRTEPALWAYRAVERVAREACLMEERFLLRLVPRHAWSAVSRFHILPPTSEERREARSGVTRGPANENVSISEQHSVWLFGY